MIVFDLRCGQGHVFEGWFGSSDDYAGQQARGLVTCPLCGSAQVGKAVMAPAVGAKSNQRADPAPRQEVIAAPDSSEARALMERLAQVQADLLKRSDWVGDAFAEQARAMHYGEAESRPVHGTVNAAEARALVEEGVPVAPLPLPFTPPEERH
jgi:hypothetical protein